MAGTFDFCVCAVPSGMQRLDKYLAEGLGICPRNQLQQRGRDFLLNGREAKPSRRVKIGDRIAFVLDDPPKSHLEAEDIGLDILYEDDQVLVVNKAQGMVVHPGAGNRQGTLANALLFHVDGLKAGDERPGIVHRLDKETSGIIITAKNDEALEYLSAQFREKTTEKAYLAVVVGGPEEKEGRISTCIGRSKRDRKRFDVLKGRGKPALTRYRVLARYDGYSFLLLRPETGRTHQLRVHMRHLGCPIAGDPLYGLRRDPTPSLMLHAYTLRIRLPGGESRSFRAPMPRRFKTMLNAFRKAR